MASVEGVTISGAVPEDKEVVTSDQPIVASVESLTISEAVTEDKEAVTSEPQPILASVEVEGVVVNIRRAVPEDRDKILQIDVSEEDIRHKEFDDLRDDLDEEDEDDDEDIWDDEDTDMFLAETAENEVIGFMMMDQIDKEGQGGGLISDMRVARTWRDKGIYEMMYQVLFEYAKTEAEMKYIRTTYHKYPEETNVREICTVKYIAFEGDAATLRDTLQSVPGMEELPLSSVIPYKQRHLRSMLRPGVGKHVLTHGLLFADGDSFTLCKDNLFELDEDDDMCVFIDNGKLIKSISFGNDQESDRATFYDIEVNCKDVKLMKSHILKQMQDVCLTAKGLMVFSILTLGFEDEIRAFCNSIEGLVEVEQYNETAVWSKITL